MKKIISMMIAVMLLVSCLPSAMAIRGGLGASSVQANPGETVTIAVTVDAADVTTIEAHYSYDSRLTFGGYTAGIAAPSGWLGLSNPEDGIAYSGTDAVSVSGTLYTLTFTVPADATETDVYPITIDGYIADADENVVYAGSGKITIKPQPTETEPETTEPETTEPETTEPETTEPETTEPKPEPSTEPEGSDDEPKTGDITPHIVMAVASVIAVAAAAMFVFKRKAA